MYTISVGAPPKTYTNCLDHNLNNGRIRIRGAVGDVMAIKYCKKYVAEKNRLGECDTCSDGYEKANSGKNCVKKD